MQGARTSACASRSLGNRGGERKCNLSATQKLHCQRGSDSLRSRTGVLDASSGKAAANMSLPQEERKFYDGLLDQKNGKWTSYWGVLKGKSLYFYKDRNLAQVVARVGINAHTHVVVSKTKAPNSYQFLVRGEATQLRLRCSTTQERTHWMDEIVRCSKSELPSYAASPSQQATPHQQHHQAIQRQPSQQQQHQHGTPPQNHGPTPGPLSSRSSVQARPLPGQPPQPSPLSLQKRSSVDEPRPSRHIRRKSSEHEIMSSPPAGQSSRAGAAAPPLPGEDIAELSQYGWFFGTMSRDRSEEIIKSATVVGSFLIRQSGSSNKSFSLSFQDEDRLRHYLIGQQTTGKYALAGLEDMSFRSLPELVKYYIEVNSGWAKPLNKTDYGIGAGSSSAAPRFQRPPAVRSDSTGSAPPPVPQPPPPQQLQRPDNVGALPMRPSPHAQVPASVRRTSLPERPSPSSTAITHPGAGARSSPQPPQGKAVPPPPASKRPQLLTRGASDLDFTRVRVAARQQKQEEADRHMRSKSVKLQPTEPVVQAPIHQFTSLDLTHKTSFEDMRRQQLFPDSTSQAPQPTSSFSAAHPSIPARSAVSLGAKQSHQNVTPREESEPYEQEDYISTADITSNTSYLNHEFRDTSDYREDEMHDYLDLQDCASPSPPPSTGAAMAPVATTGTRPGQQPPSPCSPVAPNPTPLRPPKPGGGRNGSSGRHSPLYDHVS